jgi:hypothetical protein
MTLVVLALDATDVLHAEDFGCENILLDDHIEMQSVAYRLNHPHTGEAWPSIATGLHPRDHGITGHGEWDSPVLTRLSRLAHRFNVSGEIRGKIGDLIDENTDQRWQLRIVEQPTFLDGEYRAVHNWPGVYRNESLQYIWRLFQRAKDDEISEATFIREAYTEAASKFGWLHEGIEHEVELAAVHVHLLDVMGHLTPNDEATYRGVYEDIDRMIGEFRAAMGPEDELLILSDHGMEAGWTGDEQPGRHSWRAIASTTLSDPPEHALNVKEWVEERVVPVTPDRSAAEIPEDQLRELGYIQ